MSRSKDIPKVWQHYDHDGGGYRRLRDMTASELAEREAAHSAYEAMLLRQELFEKRKKCPSPEKAQPASGWVFAKSCKLPDSIIDYVNPSGFIPTENVREYGELILLGGREVDTCGAVPLKKIKGELPAGIGSFALGGAAIAPAAASTVATGAGAVTIGVVVTALVGLVAMLVPSSLGDGALYTEDQLRSLKHARTRIRLHVEVQADGTLKGYGYNTQNRRDWEVIPVVTFEPRNAQQIADFGNGLKLIWTPAANPADTLGIPTLEAAPQAPQMWIFPQTEAADRIIVSPIYPPEYQDFILVFPADSGIRPLYVVLSINGHKYHPTPQGTLPAFPDLVRGRSKTSVQGGGGLRPRWTDRAGNIYEWDRQHGALEKYNKRGKHLGEYDHVTGEQTKKADKTREVEP